MESSLLCGPGFSKPGWVLKGSAALDVADPLGWVPECMCIITIIAAVLHQCGSIMRPVGIHFGFEQLLAFYTTENGLLGSDSRPGNSGIQLL
jgi:hypothetical protein